MDAKRKISPEILTYVDDGHTRLHIEVELPGVRKEDIKVTMHEDSMYLIAPRDEFEFRTNVSFCCPVRADDAHAKYDNGLLRIEVPFLEAMEGAVKVPVT